MRKLWLAGLLLGVGCASAPIQPADQVALDAADALVLHGCYDCLLEARDTYARLAVARARPLVLTRLFETDLLIALRHKELALDSSEAETQARSIAVELPQTFEAERVLRIVDAVLPDSVGLPRSRLQLLRAAPARRALDVHAELDWLPTSALAPAVRQYLSAALDCSYDTLPRRPGEPVRGRRVKPALPVDAAPLVEYRVAICFEVEDDTLERIRANDPRFVEAAYFEARIDLLTADEDGGGGARDLLTLAYERFAGSPAVTYLFGQFEQLVGDCRAALGLYGEALAVEPEHEAAMLGRTVCLSFLTRNEEAIESATAMTDLPTFNVSDAFYWRAWNHRVLKALELARADIESAKALAASGVIFTLAGMIEHDQDDLAVAEEDLVAARRMSGGSRNCAAAWYLGLVHMKQQRFQESSTDFEDAMECYAANVAESEAGLRGMEMRTNVDPDFKARQIAGFQAALLEDRGQYFAAAFNAANQGAQAGDRARASRLLDIASRSTDAGLLKLVAQLRELIKGSS